MRTAHSLLLLLPLVCAPALTSCAHTTEAEKVEFQNTNLDAHLDGARATLEEARATLDAYLDDAEATVVTDALGADLDAGFKLLNELVGEVERATEAGEASALSALSGRVIVLLATAGDLLGRAEALGN